MKNLLFISLLFISISAKTQTNFSDYDSLAKYSYLLVEVSFHPTTPDEQPSISNLIFEGNATGYFFRDSGKIFLCTAYHVLSSCDVYEGKRRDTRADYLLIRVLDSIKKAIYVFVPIHFSQFKTLPCQSFLDKYDFVRLDARLLNVLKTK